jgi:hypothetical protein
MLADPFIGGEAIPGGPASIGGIPGGPASIGVIPGGPASIGVIGKRAISNFLLFVKY